MGKSLETQLKILFLDLNSYFASVEQQVNPAYRHKPLIVVPMDTDGTCAIAASYEAKALGIKTGTPVWEAKSICPDIIRVPARHDLYVEFHHKIMTELDKHLPIEKICSIDEASCEIPRHWRSIDYITQKAHEIKRGIWDNVGDYINCSIGISANRLVGKIASNMQKPNGLTILSPEELPASLYDHKLTDFPGIGKGVERRLNTAGIWSVEQFCSLQAKQARKVWGSVEGERYWYQLHGATIPDVPTKKTTIGHSHVLAPELRHPEKAHLVARRLCAKASARLRRMKLVTSRLYLSVRFENKDKWTQEIKLPFPVSDSFTLLEAMDALWHQMAKDVRSMPLVRKVSTGFFSLNQKETLTGNLFDPSSSHTTKKDNASNAIDELNKKFGRDSVFIGSLPDLKQAHSMGVYSGTKIAFNRIPELDEFNE